MAVKRASLKAKSDHVFGQARKPVKMFVEDEKQVRAGQHEGEGKSTAQHSRATPAGIAKTGGGVPVLHPSFIADRPSEFQLTQNVAKNILLRTDIRGGLYATAGALPRRKINMEREYITAAARNLEPTFRIGPVMTTTRMGEVKPFVPPLQIEGYEAEFVYERENPLSYPETQVAPMPPLGEHPNGRATLSDGWIRVYKSKKAAAP